MSERNHYEEAKLPAHMRKTLLRDIEYDAPVYIDLDDHRGWTDDDNRLESVYVASDRSDKEKDGTLWADGRTEIENEDYSLTNLVGRIGLMKVLLFDGNSEKDVLLADLRFLHEPPEAVDVSPPSRQGDESEWADSIDNAIPIGAFIAHEETGEEAYYGPTGFKEDLRILRKYGDKLIRIHKASIDERARQREEARRENDPSYQKES